jgi:branched-chain amino acid transport system permease protein
VLITAIGVSLLMQNFGQLEYMFGTRPAAIPPLVSQSSPVFAIGGVKVWVVDVVGMVTALLLMLALDYLVFHTRMGRAMRAVSHSTNTASLMGIDVNRVISTTFIIGASLAAAGGFLWTLKYQQINQTSDAGWVLLGLKAFVAAVVGGIGNVRGAMLGGLAIGLLENFGAAYGNSKLTDVYVFGLLILVLLFRPGGILGKAVVEKV